MVNKEEMLSKYQASFTGLTQSGPISPIVGMDAVTIKQAADYLGISLKEIQALRQRFKKECGTKQESMTFHLRTVELLPFRVDAIHISGHRQ